MQDGVNFCEKWPKVEKIEVGMVYESEAGLAEQEEEVAEEWQRGGMVMLLRALVVGCRWAVASKRGGSGRRCDAVWWRSGMQGTLEGLPELQIAVKRRDGSAPASRVGRAPGWDCS